MKIVRILLGCLSLGAASYLLFFLSLQITGTLDINFDMINSNIDRAFWVILLIGMAGFYGTGGLYLLVTPQPGLMDIVSRKKFVVPIIICAFMTMAGVSYHFILHSPW